MLVLEIVPYRVHDSTLSRDCGVFHGEIITARFTVIDLLGGGEGTRMALLAAQT